MGIHFPELKDIDKPVVWVFPEVVVTNPAITAHLISRLVAGLLTLTRADGYYRL
jgi:hypothetical protein